MALRGASLRVFLRFPSGATTSLIVKPPDVLESLKPQVAFLGNVSTPFSFTKPSGVPIHDDATIQDCATDGTTLHIRLGPHPYSLSGTPLQVASEAPTKGALEVEATACAVKLIGFPAHSLQAATNEACVRLHSYAGFLQEQLADRERKVESALQQKHLVMEQRLAERAKELDDDAARLTEREAALNFSIAQFQKQQEALRLYLIDERVKLNVGGAIFMTTRNTLTKYENSFFNVLLSGRFNLVKDADGSIFIDRPAEMFHYVLEFLRDGTASVEHASEVFLRRLAREFAFFGLPMPIDTLPRRDTGRDRQVMPSSRPLKQQRLERESQFPFPQQ